MKILLIITAFMLFLASTNMPINYYYFLRIMVTTVAVLTICLMERKNFNFWFICFIGIALIFNPFTPIYVEKKAIWIYFDLIIGCLFVVRVMALEFASQYKRNRIDIL